MVLLDSFKNYYTILNVPEAASCDEIKAAFRRMAKLYAPDRNPDPSVVRRFEDILEAWGVLSDPEARRRYDQSRGIWTREADAPSPFAGGGEPRAAGPVPDLPPSPPVREYTKVLGRGPRRASRERARDARIEAYFDRSGVSLWVLGSLFLLVLTGWPRLASLDDVRGILKVFLLGMIFAPLFWLTFWGLCFYGFAEAGRRRFLGILYPCLFGVLYAFLAQWFLGDVREPILSPDKDWALWYGSFAVPFALLADALEPEGLLLSRLFR